MTFLCPSCKTPTLEPSSLEATLSTDRCSSCGGHWLTSQRYFAFLAELPTDNASLSISAPPPPDSPALKRCPTCLRFMHYYAISLDLPCGIDKCNTCGGIWLDALEWPALRTRGLHRRLHAISSDSWQTDLAEKRRASAYRQHLLQLLGPDDLAWLDRTAAWLAEHPHRPEIFAHLRLAAVKSTAAPEHAEK